MGAPEEEEEEEEAAALAGAAPLPAVVDKSQKTSCECGDRDTLTMRLPLRARIKCEYSRSDPAGEGMQVNAEAGDKARDDETKRGKNHPVTNSAKFRQSTLQD